MAELPIPAGHEGLTAQWLTAALREGGVIAAAEVTEARVEPIGAGRAFAGQPLRVRLRYDREEEGAPSSLVAKLPAVEPAMRRALSGLRWYESEIRFYDEVAARSDVATPRRYYTAMQPAGLDYVLLIEEVTSGVVGDQIAGATLAEAERVVDAVARLHAGWWDDRALDGFDWLARGAVRRIEAADFWAEFFERNWATTQRLMPGLLPDAVAPIAARLAQVYAGLVRASAQPPRTLLHGDVRLDNIFFSQHGLSADGETPLTFIDWQLVSAGRGPYDLAYFLGTNLPSELRAEHEEALLRRYHATIAARVPGSYSFDDCWRDYRLGLLLVFAFWVQTAGAPTYPAAGHPLRDAALTRISRALIDLDAAKLLTEAIA
ncbi:MAG: phosphotransferase [Dehalococcoidia bacterium]